MNINIETEIEFLEKLISCFSRKEGYLMDVVTTNAITDHIEKLKFEQTDSKMGEICKICGEHKNRHGGPLNYCPADKFTCLPWRNSSFTPNNGEPTYSQFGVAWNKESPEDFVYCWFHKMNEGRYCVKLSNWNTDYRHYGDYDCFKDLVEPVWNRPTKPREPYIYDIKKFEEWFHSTNEADLIKGWLGWHYIEEDKD